MANTRATTRQFVEARRPLVSVKSFSDKFEKHLVRVWNEAEGVEKAALLQHAQEALVERFGLVDGPRKFADAMKVGA